MIQEIKQEILRFLDWLSCQKCCSIFPQITDPIIDVTEKVGQQPLACLTRLSSVLVVDKELRSEDSISKPWVRLVKGRGSKVFRLTWVRLEIVIRANTIYGYYRASTQLRYQRFETCLEYRPRFANICQPVLDHSKSRLGRISDPHVPD